MMNYEDLSEKWASVYITWNDSDASWSVWTDYRRRTRDDCRYSGYGLTLEEAVMSIQRNGVPD